MQGPGKSGWHAEPRSTTHDIPLRHFISAVDGRRAVRRALAGTALGSICLCALLVLFAGSAQASSAFVPAAQPLTGSQRADTHADFLAACTVLSHLQSEPAQNRVTVSPVAGGELRLQPTLEDYFDGEQIDATKWISGYANPSFPNTPGPEIVNGVVRLDANFLRAVQPFGAEMPVRFFEASARFVTSPYPIAYADIGFYRTMPSLRVLTESTSIRLFAGLRTVEGQLPRHMIVRSRDGLFIPNATTLEDTTDTVVDNWGADAQAQLAGLNDFHTFEIRWDQLATMYLIDGSDVVTAPVGKSVPLPHPGISSAPTYVTMFSQDPSTFGGGISPLHVDWVRAGVYPEQGTYTSCISDAGEIVHWSRVALSASIPSGTAVTVEARTSVDGVTWSGWNTATVGASGTHAISIDGLPGGRYFQYRVLLQSQNPMSSPQIDYLEARFFGPKAIIVNPDVAFVNPDGQIVFDAHVLDANDEIIPAYKAPVQWSVVSGGGTINEDGLFTAGASSGRFTNTVRALSPGLDTRPATVNVGVAPALNLSPTFAGTEGKPMTLTVSANRGWDAPPVKVEWDLDNDGLFDDATGEVITHVFPKAGSYPVEVLATNATSFTGTARSVAAIQNLAPRILAINVDAPPDPGAETSVEVIAEDVPAAVLSYSFDWDNDGVFEVADQSSNRASKPLDRSAARIIGVRVRDDSGGEVVDSITVPAVSHRMFVPFVTR